MTENIKEALQYSVELASNEVKIIKDEAGKEWYDDRRHALHELDPKRYPTTLRLTTLTSLVDYIKSGLNELLNQNLIVVAKNPSEVFVYSEDDELKKRTTLIGVEVDLPYFGFDKFYDQEDFNIAMQSKFKDEEHREVVIDYASKISIENGSDIEDDGVSQVTTIKQGVASKAKAKAPNPVTLVPYRTFNEVEQPASQFVLRINKNGQLALFEADGGAWRNEAMSNVAGYLKEAFEDFENVTVLA